MKKLLTLLIFFPSLLLAQEQYTIYFDFDVDEASAPSGKRLAQWIANNKDVEVMQVYGYADSIGNPYYNIDLSERRAHHVAQQLRAANIKIKPEAEIKGFGETRAFSANTSSDRIVVIHYITPDTKVAVESAPDVEGGAITARPVPPVGSLSTAMGSAKKGDKLVLPGLNFYNNSDVPLPESQPVLRELYELMQNNPNLQIDIQGHICCQVIEEDQISKKRAKKVYSFLRKMGIKSERLSYQSFGSSRPIYPLPEKTEAEKVANRRVEIEIISN